MDVRIDFRENFGNTEKNLKKFWRNFKKRGQ